LGDSARRQDVTLAVRGTRHNPQQGLENGLVVRLAQDLLCLFGPARAFSRPEGCVMTVRIVPESASGEQAGSDYLRVRTCTDPLDDTITLATIQRFVVKVRSDAEAARLHVKTLVLRQPMSTDAALGFATRYAERKNIPVILTD
jgi:hypothetical protein